MLCTPTILASYDNTDHPSARFIDNLFHGILQFALAFFADHGKFGADAVFYQLADGFSENIGIPDAIFSFCVFFDISNQVFCLLFTADDRCDLGFDICPDQMNRRTAGFYFDTVAISLFCEGGCFETDFFSAV